MKRKYIKKTLSLLLALLLIFPVISLAAESTIISKIYFEDEEGNMVLVDYEAAINQALEGDSALYNAIRYYVGIAELKGKAIFLETNSGKILDYKLALLDNLFRLEDIIDDERYEVDHEIEYTHELKIVDGEPGIVPKIVHTNYVVSITGPEELELGKTDNFDIRIYGDASGNVSYRARYEYEISGGEGTLEYFDGNDWRRIPLSGNFEAFSLTPNWDETVRFRFTPNSLGEHEIEFYLVDIDEDRTLAEDKHQFTVIYRDVQLPELVSITPVEGIEVEFGTPLEVAINRLPKTTTILDSKGITHTVNLTWSIDNYDGNMPGIYTATGSFDLPPGVINPRGLELKVVTTVRVLEQTIDLPDVIEEIIIWNSEITNKTYANIEIKEEYVNVVIAVYVDDFLAFQMVDKPSQWRIEVEEGTTVEDLIGRIRVELEGQEDPQDEPSIIAVFHPHFLLPKFGYISVEVENVPGAAKFCVVYHLSDNEDGSQNIVETSIVNIEEQAGLLFYDPNQYDTIDIKIFDNDENLLHIFVDVVPIIQG
ncbi:MAG TPA: Ig-like domain-containing protein [Tissierellaceae bacterium]